MCYMFELAGAQTTLAEEGPEARLRKPPSQLRP